MGQFHSRTLHSAGVPVGLPIRAAYRLVLHCADTIFLSCGGLDHTSWFSVIVNDASIPTPTANCGAPGSLRNAGRKGRAGGSYALNLLQYAFLATWAVSVAFRLVVVVNAGGDGGAGLFYALDFMKFTGLARGTFPVASAGIFYAGWNRITGGFNAYHLL